MKNAIKKLKETMNVNFFSGNNKIEFSEDDMRAIAPEFLKESSSGVIDFEDTDMFSDDLESLPESEIDYSDTPAWVDNQHKNELNDFRSRKQVMNDMLFNSPDVSEEKSKNVGNISQKLKLKQHFLNAKVEKANRSTIRQENKPEWRKPK